MRSAVCVARSMAETTRCVSSRKPILVIVPSLNANVCAQYDHLSRRIGKEKWREERDGRRSAYGIEQKDASAPVPEPEVALARQ